MKTCDEISMEDFDGSHDWPTTRQPAFRPSHLHLVTVHDLRDLREEPARGHVPRDLEAKLIKLAAGDLAHRSIEQNCRTG